MNYGNRQQESTSAILATTLAALEARRAHAPRQAFAFVLLALVVLLLSAMMFVGTTTYDYLAKNREAAADLRAECNVLANCVRMADEIDSVAVGSGPEGNALVLIERTEGGTFETRLYAYQGSILQEYSVEGSAYDPARAMAVAQSDAFDFSYVNGLLTITTDSGSTSVALRSVRGGA